jgi:predicted DNA-binding transcriptional regulator AlpA
MSLATEPLMTTADVAALIGKSPHYVYANAERLAIPRIKIGKHYRCRPGEIGEWLEGQRVSA